MLEISHLRKHYVGAGSDRSMQRVMAVDGVSFTVEAGQFFTLLGPSGCGKTTTLRCIAGLEEPTSGSIVLDGRVLYSSDDRINLRANRRGLGMVFQSYAIWPHMTVAKNVAFPLTVGDRRKRPSKAVVAERTERVLAVVQLDHLANRPATDLSGGQQQRLALARALVHQPPLLLLDEPLSNLDAKLREQMRFELKRLQRELGLTTIYVTHDQSEALAMSNVIAVMRDGEIEQLGSPRDIYTMPATEFVADFIGTSSFLRGEVAESRGGGTYVLQTGEGDVLVTCDGPLVAGDRVVAVARPESISLTELDHGTLPGNRLRGKVTTSVYLGESVEALVEAGSTQLRVRTHAANPLPAGTDVMLGFEPELPRVVKSSNGHDPDHADAKTSSSPSQGREEKARAATATGVDQ